jgi:hypothetical protein
MNSNETQKQNFDTRIDDSFEKDVLVLMSKKSPMEKSNKTIRSAGTFFDFNILFYQINWIMRFMLSRITSCQ